MIRPQPQLLALGATAPALVLQSIEGDRIDALATAAHHNLVVQFFDAQCDTCARQAAQLCSVAQRHSADTVVAVDAAGESTAVVSDYARANRPSSCPVTLLLDPGLGVSRGYRAAVVPTVYVVDSNGKIAYAAVGSAGVDGLDSTLLHLGG
ncbi:MAG: TlpA family protein disulfide reductase [Candidatus Dormibacteria bacterium]